LSVITTAQVAGKKLSIQYDAADATTGPAFGCLAQDCRVIRGIGIDQ
jgi:hypothetical protein